MVESTGKRGRERIPFRKLSGAGNIFVVVEEEVLPEGTDRTQLARRACAPGSPADGADGLIVVGADGRSDRFSMDYYNSDGSTGMMCGNGGRCAVRVAVDQGYVTTPENLRFTNAGIEYRGRIVEGEVEIAFPDPLTIRPNLRTTLDGIPVRLHFVDVGTPHLLLLLEDETARIAARIDELEIDLWGPILRHHDAAGPSGANANFLELLSTGSGFRLRTFERGVEGETGACGTGAIASGLLGAILHDFPSPVPILPTSGDLLQIGYRRIDGGEFTDVTLRGPAVVIAEGELPC